jgi:regulatory protein
MPEDDQQQSDTPTPRMFSWAKNSAAYRLGRRMHTEKQLFDAISRKAREKFEDISDAQVKALADSAVKFGLENRALDDTAFAEISARSGLRSGRSRRAIAQKLTQKGVARSTVEAAVADTDDFYAAAVLARKRAFGPFRKVVMDNSRRAKELAAFARAGFGFDIGRKIVELSLEEAEELLGSSHQP